MVHLLYLEFVSIIHLFDPVMREPPWIHTITGIFWLEFVLGT